MSYEDMLRAVPGSDHAAAVDLSSTDAVLARTCQRLFVGGAGAVKVDTAGGETVTFTGVPVGYLEVRATKVYKVGTTATNLVALS